MGTSGLETWGLGDFGAHRYGVWGHGVWGLWCLGTGVLRAVPRCPRSACFREYFVHKFRAMLGKNHVIFPGEKVRGGGTQRGAHRGHPQAGDCPFCPHRCCWRCREGRHPAPCYGRCRR